MSTATERVADALQRAGKTTRNGQWQCPAHEDRTPSLSLDEGADGRALVRCHAGCGTDDVLGALELKPADLFVDERPPSAARQLWKVVATYDYTDEAGDRLYQMVRFVDENGHKQLRPRLPDGTYSIVGVRRVLYRLPEMIEAAAVGGTVFVVEGEKDADAVVRDGSYATCGPFGAGKWKQEYAEALKGCSEVVVVADRDAPGYGHALTVAKSLEDVGVPFRVARSAVGKDVAEHLGGGLPLDDLEVLTMEELRGLAGVDAVAADPVTGEFVEVKAPALFRRYTMSELAAEPDDFAWLIKGLLAKPTYGQIAGEMKTLKSYLLGFVEVSLATGLSLFDRFTVSDPCAVLAYVGEGGRSLWTRRMRRIASAMGTTFEELGDMHASFDVAPITSLRFQESLQRDLDEVTPGLVALDPLYTYHGTATKASDLHQEGALLNELSGPCMDAGASLLVANHFNQTGTGTGLKRITMAGSGEWADSWILVGHREPADVDGGVFRLRLEVGSRQWGGTSWDLDMSIGRFDEETGTHDGEITWDLRTSGGSGSNRPTAAVDRASQRIIEAIADSEGDVTKTGVKVIVGGSREVFEAAFGSLAARGVIGNSMRGRTEDGTVRRRLTWHILPTEAESDRPGCPDDEAF